MRHEDCVEDAGTEEHRDEDAVDGAAVVGVDFDGGDARDDERANVGPGDEEPEVVAATRNVRE